MMLPGLTKAQVAPTVKHLFAGFDVTIFAYGVTGTGKTHTMRGGKSLADRGVIPRLLSAIYRRGRKIEKDSAGATQVVVSMSYYEIYNDKVFDLFEPPEKRTATGLPIRDNNGKTVVCNLTERPCTTLKEFETLYDQANVNRSTAGTKLNAHSSRSHAILCVKVSQISEDRTVVSNASAIDLAGSEDNRRTDNGKERLVESSSINKSLFVLAQCVEAISKKQNRIPYRESKMTRILSLGQNNGLTIMILNLAPVRSYHLDTLSSLNFANRTKKIEVRDVENEPIFKAATKQLSKALAGTSAPRQPLRPKNAPSTAGLNVAPAAAEKAEKPSKSFAVFKQSPEKAFKRSSLEKAHRKRPSESTSTTILRPSKLTKVAPASPAKRLPQPTYASVATPVSNMTKAQLEELVERMVDERLAARTPPTPPRQSLQMQLSTDVQRRLEALEQRATQADDARAQGLQFLLMAKQFVAHAEPASALRMYRLALPHFPDNEKIAARMLALKQQLDESDFTARSVEEEATVSQDFDLNLDFGVPRAADVDADLGVDADGDGDEFIDSVTTTRTTRRTSKRRAKMSVYSDMDLIPSAARNRDRNRTTWSGSPRRSLLPVARHSAGPLPSPSPRTAHVLRVLNSRDLAQIRSLRGVGARRAEALVDALVEMDAAEDEDEGEVTLESLEELLRRGGVGSRGAEAMRRSVVI